MSSITGLKTGTFTSIDNSGEIRLGTDIDPGTTGQALLSGGSDEPVVWGTHTGIIQPLTAGTNVTYTSGSATFDGSVADTINSIDTDTTYTAGSGMDLTGTTFSTDNDGTTIDNSGGTGAQNQVLKVPNDLTAGTNIQFVGSSGPTPTYNGNDATTINNTQTDTTYAGGNNISIDTTPNPDEIDLDPAITGMTGISYSGSGGNNLTGAGMPGTGTTCTYLDVTSATNIFPTLYPNSVVPYLDVAVHDPTVYTSQSLTTSFVQIFSGAMTLTFTCMPGRTMAEVELKVLNGGGSSNRWIYLGLLDGAGTTEWTLSAGTGGGFGTGTVDTERKVHYKDETDYDYVTMSWVLTGLTPGNTYIVNPSAKTNSTSNYIYAGGTIYTRYPCCISRVTQL